MPTRDVRDHDTGLQRLGDNGNLGLVRPTTPPLNAIEDLNPPRLAGYGDITIDVIMVVIICAHSAQGSRPTRSL